MWEKDVPRREEQWRTDHHDRRSTNRRRNHRWIGRIIDRNCGRDHHRRGAADDHRRHWDWQADADTDIDSCVRGRSHSEENC